MALIIAPELLQIALVFALALVAPSMASPYNYVQFSSGSHTYGYGDATYRYANRPWANKGSTIYKAPEPTPVVATRTADAAAAPDLTSLTTVFEDSIPIVDQAEALANDIFPNDGQPIVQGMKIRTKFGDAPLPLGNILDPNVRSELAELSDALSAVVSTPELDGEALNRVLELSRDLKLNYE